MLGFRRCLFLLSFFYIYVECTVPTLSVSKLNRTLVAKKRKATLDLCLLFNAENEKVDSAAHSKHNRIKRSVSNMDDEERVENIVEKLYDELEQKNGEKVTSRQKIIKKTTDAPKSVKHSGRRFDFAPSLLNGPTPSSPPQSSNNTEDNEAKVPWHKNWKHGIVPYFIDPNTYDFYLAEKITKAFDYFERTTCVRLQRLRTKPTDKRSLKVEWLYITNPSGTRQCVHSNERKPNGGVQMVVLGYDCMSLGEIVHEVMHILGFSHEHVREDRDRYISVLWDNIKPGYKKYFKTRDTDPRLLSLPYDYRSVLHYPPRAFSKNGKYTIIAEPGVKLGQRNGLSEIDVEKVSMIYGNECMNRNKDYLLKTCPTVISTDQQATKNVTQSEINDYFRDRLWHYGIVNYRLKDRVEFSIEERENIDAVINHIEKETCVEFRDITVYSDDIKNASRTFGDENKNATYGKNEDDNRIDHNEIIGSAIVVMNKTNPSNESDLAIVSEDQRRLLKHNKYRVKLFQKKGVEQGKVGLSALEGYKINNDTTGGLPLSPSRRNVGQSGVLVLTRSPEPGCQCPTPGRPKKEQTLEIGADCFNSVNDLLHLFVHVLGLDHQHNMHDRDAYLSINWTLASEELKKEMSQPLPAAASVGFPYDYQSVMHYPWLQIKDGVTSVMYPIWNDGWVMGHWQGLSSVDVQKINLLYFEQCQARKKHIAENMSQ